MMKRSHADGRSFGLLFGAAISGLALLAAARGQPAWGVIAGLTAGATLGCAMVKPSLLRRPQRAWASLAAVLHYVNARVILTIMFGLVLWPLGTTRRLFGRDPLSRQRHECPGWIASPVRHRDRAHFTRLY